MAAPDVSRLLELFRLDAETGKLYWRVNVSSKAKAGAEAGRLRSDGYRTVGIDRARYASHRVIWAMRFGAWPSLEIDHKNGVRDDNRLENLREATQPQNRRNGRVHSNNKIGVKGVRMNQHGRYGARIQSGGHRISLGQYATIDEAAAAYDRAASALHGEFFRPR